MTLIRVFPFAVAVLELCAALVYLWSREWRLFGVWIGYALAAFLFAGIK